ncbi:MAG: ATP-binding protein [Chitinophagaceae bacterium]
MQRQLILVLFFVVLSRLALAQLARNFHIQQYTTDNGLPSNGIKGIQWDEQTGFLWIATEAGIARFNGVDFRSYTRENIPSIGSERMLFMTRNHAGEICISDLPGNVIKINKNNPELWSKTPGHINPYYDNYHLLTVSDTFFRKHLGSSRSEGFSAVTDKTLSISDTSYLILKKNELFFHHISLQSPKRLSFQDEKFNTIYKNGDHLFVTSDKKKSYLIFPDKEEFHTITIKDEQGRVIDNMIDKSHLFWEPGMKYPVLVIKEKVFLLTYDGSQLKTRLIFNGIPADAFIKSIQYSEKKGILFIGTDSKGLIVITPNRVMPMKRKNNNSGNRNSYYAQIELPTGNILTNEGDIIGLNQDTQEPLPIKGKFGYSISTINDSLIWFFQNNVKPWFSCMHRYNKNTGQSTAFQNVRLESILTSNDTDTWLANNTGILKLEADSFRYVYKNPTNVIGNIVYAIKIIQPGVMALATCAGIFRYTIADSRLDTILTNLAGCARTIWQYQDYVFFGTYGAGYYIYHNGKIKAMPLDKNKYLLYAHCFFPDGYGYCWISTNRGLFKANIEEMIHAFDRNSSEVYYHYYGKKDGLDMTELNGGCNPCAIQMKNKIISFPTMDGLLWVDPGKTIPVLPEGEIFIDEVSVDNEIKDPDILSKESLPANIKEIIFRFAFSAWCNKENIYLEYQLNDTINWKPISLGNGTVILFSNLPSGKYKLRVRKLNGFGFNNYTYKEIQFSIITPWNKQWWFYALCLLILLGIVVLFLRFRTKQYIISQRKLERQVSEKTKELKEQNEMLEKNNTIKTRLISIISHDIVTPLKFVTVAGKNLIEKRNLMTEELQKETILEMTNTSQELQLLSTNILNWIKYQNENRRMAKENFNLSELVNQVFGVLHSLANQKKLSLINEINPGLEMYQFFEPLKILIYNLLTNAINFSEKGSVKVSAEPSGNQVIIRVKDEGMGMTPEQIQNIMADQFIVSSANIDNKKGNGLGYLIIKDLVKMMGAFLNIESEKGSGTTVLIYAPT